MGSSQNWVYPEKMKKWKRKDDETPDFLGCSNLREPQNTYTNSWLHE